MDCRSGVDVGADLSAQNEVTGESRMACEAPSLCLAGSSAIVRSLP